MSFGPASNASSQAEEPLAARKTLDLATPKIRRDSALPSLTLSNKLRTRLAWLEEETGRSTEEVFNFLIDHYISWRRDPAGLAALYKVLSLARSLEVDEIDVELVYRYLTTEQILQRLGCTIEDVPPAIRLLELLSNLPEVWSWDTAQSAIQSVAFLIQAGIDPKAVRSFLANHYVLSEKGLDVRLVRILDKAFTRAGLKGQRRDQASWELVKGVALKLSIDEMEVTKKNLKSEIRGYQDTLQQITAAIHEAKPRLSRLKEDKRKVTQHLDQLETEYQRKKGHIEVFEGFVCFLLGKLKADDPFWKTLEQLLQMRHQGKISDVQAREALTVTLVPQLLNFITYVGEQTQGGPNVLH